jgi:hypothetical protein
MIALDPGCSGLADAGWGLFPGSSTILGWCVAVGVAGAGVRFAAPVKIRATSGNLLPRRDVRQQFP